MGYHYIPMCMVKTRKYVYILKISSADKDSEQLKLTYTAGKSTKQTNHSGTWFDKFLIRLNIHWPYDPKLPLMVIYPREREIYVNITSQTLVFIETLFIIAPTWRTSQKSLSGWIDKPSVVLQYHRTLLSHKEEGIMLSDRSQSQKVPYGMILFTQYA